LANEVTARGQRLNPKPIDADYNPTNGLGSWIWAAKTFDRQTCQLWRAFEVPAQSPVTHARLVMTVDNEFTLYLDGRELGRGAEWRELFDYNVTQLLSPGTHTLAVKAYNSSSFAGMIFCLRIDLADGRLIEIKSDPSWRVVPDGTKRWETKTEASKTWPAATVIAPLGGSPWWTTPQNINPMPTLEPIKVYFWQTGWFQISLLSLSGVVTLISLRLVAQLALHRKEQWLLRQERARIARDIHDDLGSRMTQLVLHGEVAQSELPTESDTRLQIDKICEEARGILSTLDEILWAVNPKRDTFRDFTSYICGYAQEFFKSTRIHCLFDLDPAASSVVLSLPSKRALLMAVKEALNNTVKHSEATKVVLQIKWQAQRLIVVISDDGKGFDKTSLTPGRNGLANLAQRMNELGGTCLVTSQPGKGCRTEFSIPLKRAPQPVWSWNQEIGSPLGAP
jgi:signal transduction histidine kinase